MTVESAQFITQLNSDYPEESATISKNLAQHISLLKNVLLRTIPYSTTIDASQNSINNVSHLTANFQTQINSISSDYISLSAVITTDIRSLSSSLSQGIADISANFEPHIDSVSSIAQAEKNSMSGSVRAEITNMSAQLSTNISNMSSSIESQVQATSATINSTKLDVGSTAYAAERINSSKLYVQTATPGTIIEGDIWFKI